MPRTNTSRLRGRLRVTADELDRALEELRQGANELTNALLGTAPPQADEPD